MCCFVHFYVLILWVSCLGLNKDDVVKSKDDVLPTCRTVYGVRASYLPREGSQGHGLFEVGPPVLHLSETSSTSPTYFKPTGREDPSEVEAQPSTTGTNSRELPPEPVLVQSTSTRPCTHDNKLGVFSGKCTSILRNCRRGCTYW
jgi:hypothetical protein